MLEGSTLIVSVLVGALVGRWWALLLAFPAGVIAASTFSFEGFSDAEVGTLFGIAVAVGLIAGVALRKGVGRFSRWQSRTDS